MSDHPAGSAASHGIQHVRSPYPVSETTGKLMAAIGAAGATLFTMVDHSGEAERAGLSLRDTKLLVFGSPVAGTPVMVAAPLAALDLPLKILVWQDDDGAAWMSYSDPDWLADRHGRPGELGAPLHAPAKLTAAIAASARKAP
jgi:uncharacterized protein (DUF302 family)